MWLSVHKKVEDGSITVCKNFSVTWKYLHRKQVMLETGCHIEFVLEFIEYIILQIWERKQKGNEKFFLNLSNTNHNVARRTVFPKMMKEPWLISLRRGYKQVASYGLISFLYGYEEEDIWSKSLKKNYRKENAVKEVMELAKEVSKYSWKYRRFWAVITLDNAFNSAS